MEAELYLEVLDTRFALRGDPAWVEFMDELWRPFRAAPDGRAVTIEVRALPKGWRVSVGEDKILRGSNPWVLSGDLRHLIIQRVMADSPGFLALHAAVVARGPDALVLAGASRAGKTTLALQLVARGWQLVSDDVAAVDRASGSVRPFLKPVSIKDAATFEALRRRWRVPPWVGEPQGEFLVPAAAISSAHESLYRPRWLAFLERVADASVSLTKISPAHATALLGGAAGGLDGAAELAALTQFCRSTINASLTYGETRAASDTVEELWG
jgi:hypothetical protein